MKKRFIALLLVAMASAGLISGCTSSKGKNSNGENEGGKKEVTVITVNDAAKLFHKDIIPEFEKEHKDIKVTLIETPFDQFDTKIQTMLASNTPLDTATHNGWTGFGSRLANDQLLPLNDLMEKNNFTTEQVNIPEEAAKVWQVNGETYAIPVHIFPTVLLYNKAMFDEAGIPYPPTSFEDSTWTFDKMLEYAKILTKNTDDLAKAQYGLLFNWDAGGREQLPEYFGYHTFDEATFTENSGFASECYFDSPEVIDVYQKVADLVYDDGVSPNNTTTEAMGNSPFFAGKCAMFVAGGWELAGIPQVDFDVGVAAVPNGGSDTVRSVMWIDPYWIFKNSKEPDATFEYIMYLLQDDVQKKIVEYSGLAPANMAAFDTYAQLFPGIEKEGLKEVFDGGVKYGQEGFSHMMPDASSLNTLITNEMNPIFNEGKSAAEVMPSVQKSVEEYINTTNEKYGK
ncbi:MAG: ABC transporter substrate-binding protein [Massiliimalia sp.]|jgi:multiple sugar transport system substrate-binding protein